MSLASLTLRKARGGSPTNIGVQTSFDSPMLELAEDASTAELSSPAQLAEVKKTSEDAPSSFNAEPLQECAVYGGLNVPAVAASHIV